VKYLKYFVGCQSNFIFTARKLISLDSGVLEAIVRLIQLLCNQTCRAMCGFKPLWVRNQEKIDISVTLRPAIREVKKKHFSINIVYIMDLACVAVKIER
jgi:hypothetical protein